MAAAASRSPLPPALSRVSSSASATRPPSEPVPARHRLGCLKSRPLTVPASTRTCLPTSLRLPIAPAAVIRNADSADGAGRERSGGSNESAFVVHCLKAVTIASATFSGLLLVSGPAAAFSGSHASGGLGQGELGWSETLETNAGGGGGDGGQDGGGGGGGGEGGKGGGTQQFGRDDEDEDDVDEADNPEGISEPLSPVTASGASDARVVAIGTAGSNASDSKAPGTEAGGRDAAGREFPKRRSGSRRRPGGSGNAGGGGATLLNSYPPDVLFASLSAVASSAGRGDTGGAGNGGGDSAAGGGSSSAGGASSGTLSSRRRRPDDERMRRADGMFDWMAGLLHSMLATRLDGMQDRVDRQALMAETADLVVQILDKRSADDAFAHRSEVSALRRLQREAFQDLLRVKDRLHRLEFLSGIRQSPDSRSARPSAGSALGATAGAFGTGIAGIGEESGVWGGLGAGAGSVLGGAGRTRLHGEIAAGGAFVPTEGARSHSTRAALEQAGMRSGLTVKFRFDTTCRDDDLLSTELTAGLGEDSSSFMLGGPVNVHKILYSTKLCDGVQLAVAPLGAVGSDVAEGMNPLKDQGLTRFASGGISLHRRARGSAVALSLRNSSASFTAAQFLSGWGVSQDPEGESAGLCASSLAQLSLQPQDNVVLSMSALNRLWPSPPLPSATGLHWSEMGPLVVPKLLPWLGKAKKGRGGGSGDGSSGTGGAESSSGGVVGQELWLPPEQESATMVQSVAVSGAVQLGPATFAAWAQAENGDCLDEDARRKLQWSASLLIQRKGREDEEGRNGTGGSNSSSSGGSGNGGKAGTAKGKKKGSWTDRISLGACIGGTQPDAFFLGGAAESSSTGAAGVESAEGNEAGGAGAGQVQAEAFLRVKCGRGLVLQPGVVVARNERTGQHTAFMLRSSWAL